MPISNSHLEPVFAVPIWTADLSPVSDKELELVKQLEYMQHPREDKKLKHTKQTYLLNTEPGLARIREELQKAVEHYWHNVLCVQEHLGLRPLHSWITKHGPGDSHIWHQDPNTLVSAIFYLKAPDGCGDLCFRKDLNYCNLFPNVMEMQYHTYTTFNNREFRVTPRDNMIVVFPAHIEHSVSENLSNEDRFALVVDYWPTGTSNYGIDNGDWDQQLY